MGAGLGFQSVFAAPDGAGLFPPTGLVDIDFALRDFLRRDWVLGFDLAGGGANGVAPVVEAPFHFSEASIASSLTVEWPHRYLTPFVGGRLALLLMNRTFEDNAFPAQFYAALSPGCRGRRGVSFLARDQRGRARPPALPLVQRRRQPFARLLGARNHGGV